MTDHQIGHNGGPPIRQRQFKRRWATALFAHLGSEDKPKPAGSVAMAFRLYMEMDGEGRGAVISNEEFSASCGVSDRSIRYFKRWLLDFGFICISVRGTRWGSSEFQATIPGDDSQPADIAAIEDSFNRHPLPLHAAHQAANHAGVSGDQTANAAGVRGHQPASIAAVSLQPATVAAVTDQTANAAGVATEPYKESPSEILLPLENINIPIESSKDEKRSRALSRPKPTEDQFVRFWEAYPKREGKAKAREIFFKLTRVDAEKAVLAAAKFANEVRNKGTESKFVKWAEGWLSARRFEDYEPDDKPWWKGREADLSSLDETFWRRLIAKHANGVWDARKICLPPGHPNCPLPKSLIADMRLLEVYGPSQSHKWRGME